MESENLEVGKIYDVFSIRKGKFKIKVTRQDDTFVTGLITEGKAKAIHPVDEVEKGGEVIINKRFTMFTEVS